MRKGGSGSGATSVALPTPTSHLQADHHLQASQTKPTEPQNQNDTKPAGRPVRSHVERRPPWPRLTPGKGPGASPPLPHPGKKALEASQRRKDLPQDPCTQHHSGPQTTLALRQGGERRGDGEGACGGGRRHAEGTDHHQVGTGGWRGGDRVGGS